MKVAEKTGKAFGRVVAGTISAPKKSATRLTSIGRDLSAGFKTGLGTTTK